VIRLHDRYVARAFLSALGAALLVLTTLVVVYDLADRIDKLSAAFDEVRSKGMEPYGTLAEYYVTFVPFLWIKILPIAVVLAAGLSITWLARQNELAPLVAAGVPTRRVLLPVLVVTVLVAGGEAVARETVAPTLSRRHDDLHRMLFERKSRLGRFRDVPHLTDLEGRRLSMSAYVHAERRMEGVWVTVPQDPAAGGSRTAYRYPELEWDDARATWVASRGGERRTLTVEETGTSVKSLSRDDPVPVALRPELLELVLRQGAAMGLSSAEIKALADAHPDKPRFRLLLHEQPASSASTIVLLLVGLPLAFRLGRRGTMRAFARALAACAAFVLVSMVATDLGARGTLNPVVAAWTADVVFGALGVVLWLGLES
jgi:lipopolysaccharide export LptBFGC system permease protein LptF